MSIVKKDSNSGIEFFDWEVPNGSVLIRAATGFRVNWYYYDGNGADIISLPRNLSAEYARGRVKNADGLFCVDVPVVNIPHSYKGKKLSKRELKFLLNTYKEWGDYLNSNPEYIGSLLKTLKAVNRNSRRNYWMGTFGAGVLGMTPGAWLLSHIGTSNTTLSIVLLGGGFAVPFCLGLYCMAFRGSSEVMQAFSPIKLMKDAKEEDVHEDFREFRKYLVEEYFWNLLPSEESLIVDKPKPWLVNEYKLKTDEIAKQRAVDSRNRQMAELKRQQANVAKAISEAANPALNKAISRAANSESITEKKAPRITRPAGSWVKSHEVLDNVKREWISWEMDILRVVQYPALFNAREPATADFHKALLYAESIRSTLVEPYSASHPYLKAVTDLQFAWTTAQSEAKRIEQSNFEEEERERLSRALDLLRIALNASGTPAERQGSYKRAMVQLKGLIYIPVALVKSIESGIGLRALEN